MGREVDGRRFSSFDSELLFPPLSLPLSTAACCVDSVDLDGASSSKEPVGFDMGVDGTLDSCTVSSTVPGGPLPLPDGRRELSSASSYVVFTGDTRPSSGLTDDLLVDILARDSLFVASERLGVLLLPIDGLLELFVIEPRRLEVRGGGILERSGSETSTGLSTGVECCRSGLPSCANAFCTAAGDRVDDTGVGVDVGPVPLTPRLGLGLALFLCREKERFVLFWWLLPLTTREVRRTGEASREELVELFAEADADRLAGVDNRGTRDKADEPFRRVKPFFVSPSMTGLLRPVPGEDLARADFWVDLLAGVDDSLDGMARAECESGHPNRIRGSHHAIAWWRKECPVRRGKV